MKSEHGQDLLASEANLCGPHFFTVSFHQRTSVNIVSYNTNVGEHAKECAEYVFKMNDHVLMSYHNGMPL